MVSEVKVTVLVEDSVNPNKTNLSAQHGLSFLVEAKTGDNSVFILMDTGPSPDVLLHNVDAMAIDLHRTEVIVLSHGHRDHVTGLLGALKRIGKQGPVIMHPKIFDPKFKAKPNLRFIGAPFEPRDVQEAGGVLLHAGNPVTISRGIMTTGEIERRTLFEKPEDFWTVHDGRFVEDLLFDEQALIIDLEDKGLVVLTGCAHAGVVNTVRHAQKIAEKNKIHAVLGGFHLTKANDNKIQSTVNELAGLNVDFIGPCHCSGNDATARFTEVLGDRCHPLQTGDVMKL